MVPKSHISIIYAIIKETKETDDLSSKEKKTWISRERRCGFSANNKHRYLAWPSYTCTAVDRHLPPDKLTLNSINPPESFFHYPGVDPGSKNKLLNPK